MKVTLFGTSRFLVFSSVFLGKPAEMTRTGDGYNFSVAATLSALGM